MAPERRPRLLIVEDEAPLQRVLERGLAKHFEVKLANDGVEALEIVASDPDFDLVLTDLRMPTLDGFGLHDELVKRHRELAARTVFMSGSTADADIALKLRTLGVSAVVKPFVVAELAKKLLELLDAIGLNERAGRTP